MCYLYIRFFFFFLTFFLIPLFFYHPNLSLQLFIITLLKKYISEMETTNEFERLESGKDIREYKDTKIPMSEKSHEYSYDSNINDNSNSNEYNLPQYSDK